MQPLRACVFVFVMLGWFGYAGAFLFRRKPPPSSERKRDRAWIVGFVLQAFGYALVWCFRRPWLSPILPLPAALEVVLAALTIALIGASVYLAVAAVRALGKEWAFTARIVEGHRLVTHGPYRLVRNPIYSAMLGMLLATGLVLSQWLALLLATAIFLAGTALRVQAEERLLGAEFGEAFEAYRRDVPALLPRL